MPQCLNNRSITEITKQKWLQMQKHPCQRKWAMTKLRSVCLTQCFVMLASCSQHGSNTRKYCIYSHALILALLTNIVCLCWTSAALFFTSLSPPLFTPSLTHIIVNAFHSPCRLLAGSLMPRDLISKRHQIRGMFAASVSLR